MKTKKNQTITILFITVSFLSLFILIITLTFFKDILKVKAERERRLNEYNWQVQQFRKGGDPLITPAPKLK